MNFRLFFSISAKNIGILIDTALNREIILDSINILTTLSSNP